MPCREMALMCNIDDGSAGTMISSEWIPRSLGGGQRTLHSILRTGQFMSAKLRWMRKVPENLRTGIGKWDSTDSLKRKAAIPW